MRSTLIILLLIASSILAEAQTKHKIYLDIAVTTPGLSATYTRKLTPHFDIGGGLSSYYFSDADYGNSRSAVYLDLRPHWGAKKSLFFIFTDLGMAFNAGPQPRLATMSPLGVYVAFGPGYCYRINKRGMGPYLSLGMYGHTLTARDNYPPPTSKSGKGTIFDASSVISVGFKF